MRGRHLRSKRLRHTRGIPSSLSLWNIPRGTISQMADRIYMYIKSNSRRGDIGGLYRQCTFRDLIKPETETLFPRSQIPGRDRVWDLGGGMLGFTHISSIFRRDGSLPYVWRSTGRYRAQLFKLETHATTKVSRQAPKILSRLFCTNSCRFTLYRLRMPIYLVLYRPG